MVRLMISFVSMSDAVVTLLHEDKEEDYHLQSISHTIVLFQGAIVTNEISISDLFVVRYLQFVDEPDSISAYHSTFDTLGKSTPSIC